jgi:hypothetical protein
MMSNSHAYMEAAKKCRELREEYEREAAKVDILRWKMMQAEQEANDAWRSLLCQHC